jgi:hypothetical protein
MEAEMLTMFGVIDEICALLPEKKFIRGQD